MKTDGLNEARHSDHGVICLPSVMQGCTESEEKLIENYFYGDDSKNHAV